MPPKRQPALCLKRTTEQQQNHKSSKITGQWTGWWGRQMEVESDRRQPISARNSATKARKTSIPSIGNENKCFNFAGLTERQRAANQQNIPQYRTTTMPPSSLHNYTYQQVVEKICKSWLPINQSWFNFQSISTSPNSFSSSTNQSQPSANTDQKVDQLIREMEWKMRTGYGAAGEGSHIF